MGSQRRGKRDLQVETEVSPEVPRKHMESSLSLGLLHEPAGVSVMRSYAYIS